MPYERVSTDRSDYVLLITADDDNDDDDDDDDNDDDVPQTKRFDILAPLGYRVWMLEDLDTFIRSHHLK